MKRLLIVEDKESLADMLREAVEADGFEADVASSGSATSPCSRICGCRERMESRCCARQKRAIPIVR
jgi:CheY-like chemotaxis protein